MHHTDDLIIQRRNPFKNHFVNTSNVLLWCYQDLSDASRRLYQILDSFDYVDPELGTSKGFVYPSVDVLTSIMGKTRRSIFGYLNELIKFKLITRVRRQNQPSLYIIEDISQDQIEAYARLRKSLFAKSQSQTHSQAPHETDEKNSIISASAIFCTSEVQNIALASLYEIKEKEIKENVNVNGEKICKPETPKPKSQPSTIQHRDDVFEPTGHQNRRHDSQAEDTGSGPEAHRLSSQESKPEPGNETPDTLRSKSMQSRSVGDLLSKYRPGESQDTQMSTTDREDVQERDYVAGELARELDDETSLGWYRKLARLVPHQVLFEKLSRVKNMQRDGLINTSPGRFFTFEIKQWAKGKGIDLISKSPP